MSDLQPPASPPCYLHELEQPLTTAELIAQLNALLEGERAGARGLHELTKQHTGEVATLLHEVAQDEGRFCVMLRRHIARLGGVPTDKTGVFYDKLMAKPSFVSQLALLDRGQAAVVVVLEKILPRLTDAELTADLQEMLDVHVVNIRRCAEFGRGIASKS